MQLTEGLLSLAAYALATIATLRAGSRVSYLISHDEIGVMEGPLILPPCWNADANQTDPSPLYELAQGFRLAVHLALAPDKYPILDPEHWQLSTSSIKATGGSSSSLVRQNATLYHGASSSTTRNSNQALIKRSIRRSKRQWKRFASRFRERLLPIWSLGVQTTESVSVHLALTSAASSEAYSLSPLPSTSWEGHLNHTMEEVEQAHHAIQSKQLEQTRPSEMGFFSHFTRAFPSPAFPSRRMFQIYDSWQTSTYSWASRSWKSWTGTSDDDSIDEVMSDDREEAFNFSNTITADVGIDSINETIRMAEVTAYAPEVFADLRSKFQVSEAEFTRSILGSGPFVSFQSNSKGAARTGGVFYFTRDGAYMIKTIRASEARTLLKMLPKYYKHMKRYARRSLLTRFFGMYRVRLKEHLEEEEKDFVIVIMNSVFPAEASKFTSERFDLKGSTVGRECSEEERQRKGRDAILKDLDLAKEVELVRSFQQYPQAYGLHVGPKAKAMLLSQLRRDVSLLVDCNVMDYSLLVGVVNMDLNQVDEPTLRALDVSRHEERKLKRARSRRRVDHQMLMTISAPLRIMMAPSWYYARKFWSLAVRTVSSILTLPLPYYGAGKCVVDGGKLSVVDGTRHGNRAIYYMGVIDFLQPWTARKVLERQIKGMMGYDTTAISCVDPKEYAARFLEFIEAHTS